MKHYSPADYPFTGSIGQYIGRSALLKDRLLDRYLAPLDITSAQFKVLMFIYMDRANTPADLCRELSVDSGSMTRMLDRLEKKGLLLRKPARRIAAACAWPSARTACASAGRCRRSSPTP